MRDTKTIENTQGCRLYSSLRNFFFLSHRLALSPSSILPSLSTQPTYSVSALLLSSILPPFLPFFSCASLIVYRPLFCYIFFKVHTSLTILSLSILSLLTSFFLFHSPFSFPSLGFVACNVQRHTITTRHGKNNLKARKKIIK